jgi:photosystem II stability/assembly factor-like uncharacterized protein
LDLEGVKQELEKSVRRTDQLLALTENGSVVTAVGSGGLIITSPIKSLEWTRNELAAGPNFVDIDSCPDHSMIALAMERQVWIGSDNGQHWVKSDLPTQEDILSLTCAPNGDYWVVGSFSTLLHSTDGGQSWGENSLGEDAMLTDIQFLNAQNALVTGEFGLIFETEDGGENWRPAGTIPDDFYPMGSFFSDRNNGWVAGLGGAILHTADGGQTWMRQETATELPLYGFYAKGGALFAFGDHGTVLELDDQRWDPVAIRNLSGYIRDGVAVSDDQLLVAGDRGNLFTLDIEQSQLMGGRWADAR